MLIDWFTVAAQALNFFVLVWLMKRFLYKPILNAIAEREKKIASELANADKKKAEAQKESEEFKRKNSEFDAQRAALLAKAADEANAERQRLLDEARNAADALSAKRQETLRTEEHALHQAIRRRTQQEVFSVARKALGDLAGAGLEERMGGVFISRLKGMEGQAKASLAGALKTARDPALVRSAFDLPAEQRAAIQKALNEIFSAEIRVRFETAPDLIGGIELATNGQKVAWSISDYLASMENSVEELLKEKDKIEVKTDMTARISKRAYELYEQQGHKSDSAVQNWDQAEREIRKGEGKAKAKVETKPAAKPEIKSESKPEAKPDVKLEMKPEVKPEVKPEAKPEAKHEVKAEPRPEAKVEIEPGTKPDVKLEAKS